jgi:putative restriction endonuclease
MNQDDQIRLAASDWLNEQTLIYGEALPRRLLEQGFYFQEQRITLMGPQGIWKPQVMDLPISITTVPDGPYDDGAIEEGSYHYKYRGTNPNHPDNVGLREVMKQYKPLIYFFGTVKGMYVPQFPVYIVYDSIPNLSFTIIIEDKLKSITVDQEDPVELYKKHYKTVNTIVRLHQRSFREKVMRAYKSQCSLCRLRHEELLDAAHIIVDKDDWGDPIVQNGLSLCKIHHAAYDKHILGISPDYQVKVREDILEEVDGPMLKFGIQGLNNQQLILPGSRRDWPDQLRLEQRFHTFLRA